MTDTISPLTLKKLLEEHALCQDPVYFYQRYVAGKPATPETKNIIREAQRIDILLSDLKKRRRV